MVFKIIGYKIYSTHTHPYIANVQLNGVKTAKAILQLFYLIVIDVFNILFEMVFI